MIKIKIGKEDAKRELDSKTWRGSYLTAATLEFKHAHESVRRRRYDVTLLHYAFGHIDMYKAVEHGEIPVHRAKEILEDTRQSLHGNIIEQERK